MSKAYADALRDGHKVGAANAEGLDMLALWCEILPTLIPAASPKLVYEGAAKKGLTYREVAHLSDHEVCDLMWV
jgi:hypothetical protein